MRHLLFFILIALPVFAQPVHYPLGVGDRWQYVYFMVPNPYPSGYSVRVTSDTTLPNGKVYALLLYDNNISTDLLRQSGDSVFVFDKALQSEILYFDFSRSVGDTVSTTARGTDTIDIVLTQKLLSSYWGRSLRVWVFSVNPSRHAVDDEYSVYVADSLGVVLKTPGFGDSQPLVGAVINGIKYGTIDAVYTRDRFAPSDFELSHNFPNPFNPTTTIRFSLPVSSPVTVEVFNTLGQPISNLYYSQLQAGTHDVRFDGTALPSGVYYYRVSTDVGQLTQKMMLQK